MVASTRQCGKFPRIILFTKINRTNAIWLIAAQSIDSQSSARWRNLLSSVLWTLAGQLCSRAPHGIGLYIDQSWISEVKWKWQVLISNHIWCHKEWQQSDIVKQESKFVGGESAQSQYITTGVPQDGALVLIIFNCCINYLISIIRSHDLQLFSKWCIQCLSVAR